MFVSLAQRSPTPYLEAPGLGVCVWAARSRRQDTASAAPPPELERRPAPACRRTCHCQSRRRLARSRSSALGTRHGRSLSPSFAPAAQQSLFGIVRQRISRQSSPPEQRQHPLWRRLTHLRSTAPILAPPTSFPVADRRLPPPPPPPLPPGSCSCSVQQPSSLPLPVRFY